MIPFPHALADYLFPLDSLYRPVYRMRRLNFLRTNLIALIVSLLVLTGYGVDVFGACCDHLSGVQTAEHGKAPSDKSQDSPSSCKCVCHQVVTPTIFEPLKVAGNDSQTRRCILPRSEFPPDAEPSGIDYPPQLS